MISEIYAFLNRNLKKPLNVQIDEARDYLSSYRIDASDEVYLETNNPQYTVAEGVYYTIPIDIKVNLLGVVRVSFKIKYINYYIDVNGVEVASGYESTSTLTVHSEDIEINDGDVITIRIKGRNSTTSYNVFSANTLNVCGYITPLMETNLIEVTEV